MAALGIRFLFPADFLTAVLTGLAQFYGEPQALQLFREDWLRDCSDRWVNFASQLQAKITRDHQGEPRAPSRGAVPLQPDDKDRRIKQLEKDLKKAWAQA